MAILFVISISTVAANAIDRSSAADAFAGVWMFDLKSLIEDLMFAGFSHEQ